MQLVSARTVAQQLFGSMQQGVQLLQKKTNGWGPVGREVHASAILLAARTLHRLGAGALQHELLNDSALPSEVHGLLRPRELPLLTKPLPTPTIGLQHKRSPNSRLATAGGMLQCMIGPRAQFGATATRPHTQADGEFFSQLPGLTGCMLHATDTPGHFSATIPADHGFMVMFTPFYVLFPVCFRAAVNQHDVATGQPWAAAAFSASTDLMLPVPLALPPESSSVPPWYNCGHAALFVHRTAASTPWQPITPTKRNTCTVQLECTPLTPDAMATLDADSIGRLTRALRADPYTSPLPTSDEQLSTLQDTDMYPALADYTRWVTSRAGGGRTIMGFPSDTRTALFARPTAELFDWKRSATATITLAGA